MPEIRPSNNVHVTSGAPVPNKSTTALMTNTELNNFAARSKVLALTGEPLAKRLEDVSQLDRMWGKEVCAEMGVDHYTVAEYDEQSCHHQGDESMSHNVRSIPTGSMAIPPQLRHSGSRKKLGEFFGQDWDDTTTTNSRSEAEAEFSAVSESLTFNAPTPIDVDDLSLYPALSQSPPSTLLTSPNGDNLSLFPTSTNASSYTNHAPSLHDGLGQTFLVDTSTIGSRNSSILIFQVNQGESF